MSGYKYSWPSDYLDPIPPTAIKKWGRSGLPGRDNCLWGGQEGKVGEGPKGVRRRDVCTCVSVCAHSFSVQSVWWRWFGRTRGDAISAGSVCPQPHTQAAIIKTTTLGCFTTALRGTRRLLAHMDTSSLAASQIYFKRGGSVEEIRSSSPDVVAGGYQGSEFTPSQF